MSITNLNFGTIKNLILLTILKLFLTEFTSAQVNNIKFRRLSMDQGLSQANVNDITQDHQGFLWFGTQDGLNRYDGYKFSVYRHNPSDPNSLSDNFIWRLLVDSHGTLWIGTQNGGLNRYDPQSDGFTVYRHNHADSSSLLNNNITAIYEDHQGALWVGTWGGGLSQMDLSGEGFIHYTYDPADSSSLIDSRVGTILEDSLGDLWVGTWNGLARMKKADRHQKVFLRYYYKPKDPYSLPHENIWVLKEDPLFPGDILIGTYGGGLCRFQRNSGNFIQNYFQQINPDIPTGNMITSIIQDHDGLLWIGDYISGLKVYDPIGNTISHYRNNLNDPASLSSDEVVCLYQDLAGAIWVGTGAGISVYDQNQKKFLHYRYIPNSPQSLSHNKVRAVYEDSEGGLWVGTKGGGLSYHKAGSNRFVHYLHNPKDPYSISDERVTSIYERKNREIWIGTEKGGLNRLERKSGRFYHYLHDEKNSSSLSSNNIMVLYENSAGNLLAGTSGGGLNRYDDQSDSFVHYTSDSENPNTLSGNWVWALFEDSQKYLWIGTWGRGVNRLDPVNNQIVRYLHDPADSLSINNNTVWCITEDPLGNLWMGTWGGGLDLFSRKENRFYHITEQDGLPNNTVYGILADSLGNLWISTNKGIARISWRSINGESGFEGNTTDLKKKIIIKNYDISDGLQSNEFNQGAFYKGKSGIMYFGGINGLNSFHPEKIHENSIIPPVVITAFKVFEKPVSFYQAIISRKPLIFAHHENYFSIEYASLDYTAPSKNQYAYIMEGLNENWISAGDRRFVSYSDLDPGEYVFRVKGTNSDGVWNKEGISFQIIITPPFWQTWWFRVLVVIFICMATYGIYRYRVKQLLAIEQLRTRLAADLHDDIASNLSSIVMFGKIIQDESVTVGPKQLTGSKLLENIIKLSQESVTSIREIIWAIDPIPETLYDLLIRVYDLAVTTCRERNIILKFDVPPKDKLPSKNLFPEQRKHLWLLLKEAINNAVKHSGCNELSIQNSYKSGILNININDNGCGFDDSDFSIRRSGKGLETMKSRAEQLGGSFTIHSRTEKGTSIFITTKI
jgi:ligand-binding sensor domain-containing protein